MWDLYGKEGFHVRDHGYYNGSYYNYETFSGSFDDFCPVCETN